MPDRSILRPLGLFLLLALGWLAIGFVVQDAYWRLMLTLVPIWGLLAVSWNIFSGYSGLVSFGHAAFFGLGAYLVALGQARFGLTPWLGIPLATVLGGAAGAAIGYPTFRLRGNYFALAMLAYPLMLVSLFGWMGFQEVSVPLHREAPGWYMQFGDGRIDIAIALALLTIGFAASLLVERSRFGLSLLAIKQNELAAEAAGIDTRRWKMRAMVLSGALAAAAGGFYAVVLLVVTPNSVFGLVVSAQAMILSLFGGAGTVWGPLIGAVVLVPLGETLQAELGHILPGIQGVIYGIAVIVVILAAPEGLYWKLRDLRRRAPAMAAAEAPPAPPAAALRPPLGAPILEVEGLSKSYGGVHAVSDVSFSVRAGEILGIIGPNGAGKTTLFNLLNGLVQPSQGSVRYEGQSLAGLRPSGICRRGIGRTFQVVRAFPRMSARENVVVGAFVAHGTDDAATRAADAALAQVGLSHRAGAAAGTLTNRELRLMELARALAAGPKLVLLDEPLAGLGSTDTEALIAVVRTLPSLGITVVIIEHSMPAMLGLVDRFLVLDNGRLLTEGPPQEVLRRPAVVEAYLGRKWATADADG
ncbi:ABC transporter permease subunit [Roseomonas haemaphysalidis]|uniref:Branched-chain amino acid ABC transporter ATP-binding protein/permease n=1 Tax=Roseomonas haemaphysalidis TaxID=2768162 RepID=A0ABS3KV04_9PROT|nr:branched-chain amino acid ABC transporter ATP-binding protein/permease [Roseomonas haemaphysalidis]MBO1081315.1 branched-chain amino acid ABC transporter ATP-binding protein/permease [Roseomonas haemaphysalidis]